MRRSRKAKIVATLGPASTTEPIISKLFETGVDIFRFNFSHGTHEEHKKRLDIVRQVESRFDRPIGILLDLQGPKLRVGTFKDGPVSLQAGDSFRLDLDSSVAGTQQRVGLPHPEIFDALHSRAEVQETDLLLDDGRIRLRVEKCGSDFAETRVLSGGKLSDRKGVNVPSVVLPISALTEKDRIDLQYGLELGIDWVALSFVQRPEDIREIKSIIQDRAGVIAKIEKPAAVEQLDAIIVEADAIMVARGDLGVEIPAERVPALQKSIIRQCRMAGKPVIVATQMLESMIEAPVPTRAEASDVATAIYDAADAVMLSAESAAGKYPIETVKMMNDIIEEVETDMLKYQGVDTIDKIQNGESEDSGIADAICRAMYRATSMLHAAATVSYTSSGYSSLRAARERSNAPVLSLTPELETARRMTLVWGVHSIHTKKDIVNAKEMLDHASEAARQYNFAQPGDHIVIIAGMPFGNPGTTNLMYIAQV